MVKLSWRMQFHTHHRTLQTMCAGLAVMLGPPTVGGSCYLIFARGKSRVWRSLKRDAPESGTFGAGVRSPQ